MSVSSYGGWAGPFPAPAPVKHATAVDVMLFGLAVLLLLIYSQGWMHPMFGDATDTSESAVVRAMYFPAYAAGALVLAFSFGDTGRAMLRQPFLILLLLVVVASKFWSVAPDQTSRRIIAIGFTTLGGVVLGSRYRWSQLAETLAACYALLAVASFGLGLLVPSLGRMTTLFPGAWCGVWQEKNGLGDNMSMGFALMAAAALLEPRRRLLWGGMAGLAVLLVVMSTSKTSLVSLMLGMAGLGFVWLARRGPILGVITSFGAVLGVFGLLALIFFAADVMFAVLGKDATLTGRTKIWAGVMYEIRQRPLLGYGYGAVWDDMSGRGPVAWITKIAKFRAAHAHNSWLEQWLGLGLVGLGAWTLTWLQAMGRAIVAIYNDKGALLAFPFLLVYSLVSLTESITMTYNDFRWVVFVAVIVKLGYPDRVMDRNRDAVWVGTTT